MFGKFRMKRRRVTESLVQYLDEGGVVVQRGRGGGIVLIGKPERIIQFGSDNCMDCLRVRGMTGVGEELSGGLVKVRCEPGDEPSANRHCWGI